MRRPALALAALAMAAVTASAPRVPAAVRPTQGNGACLSCHQRDLPTLPARSCLSCHRGSMDFLDAPAPQGPERFIKVLMASGGLVPALALAALGHATPAEAAPGPASPPGPAPFAGAILLARDHACDLQAVFSPDGEAVLFARRGPDTSGDGRVDLRDGRALFLLRRGWNGPLRLTPYALDFAPGMASWSHSGRHLVVPAPLSDTDGDGLLSYADRHGLVVFDADGRQEGRMDPGAADATDPFFSPDGEVVAFVEERAIRLWNRASGKVETAFETPSGTFPRLMGWGGNPPRPVFVRGQNYAAAGRTPEGRYDLAADVAVEAAWAGSAATVSAHGTPSRRQRGTALPSGVFTMVQGPSGPRGLVRIEGHREIPISPPGWHVGAFAPGASGEMWLLARPPGGTSFRILPGPVGAHYPEGPSLAPRLVGFAAGDGFALAAGPERSGAPSSLVLVHGDGSVATLNAPGEAWFLPAAAGRAAAAVRVIADTDGDGDLTPLDAGELWITWEAP